MATKTEKRIERDFYEFVTKSELAKAVSGKVYRKGMRPPESDKEDIVVKFLSGVDEQVQSGIVVLNIYVPDISVRSRGAKVENIKRIDELEELAVSFNKIQTNNNLTLYEYGKESNHVVVEVQD